jgi:hypothetical protein
MVSGGGLLVYWRLWNNSRQRGIGHSRGARARRQPVWGGDAAHAKPGGCRGSRAGGVSQGVSVCRPVRAGHEPEGLATHDPAQHVLEYGAFCEPKPGRDGQRDVEASAAPTERSESPEHILLRDTLDADLQAAIDSLPEVFRQAVWLRDVEEFTYAEIAEMLNVAPGTVM